MQIGKILQRIDAFINHYKQAKGTNPPRIVLERPEIEALKDKGIVKQDMTYRDIQIIEQ